MRQKLAELRPQHRTPDRFPAWNGPVIHGTQGTPIGSPAPGPSVRQGVTGHLNAIPVSLGPLHAASHAPGSASSPFCAVFLEMVLPTPPCPPAILAAFSCPGLSASALFSPCHDLTLRFSSRFPQGSCSSREGWPQTQSKNIPTNNGAFSIHVHNFLREEVRGPTWE